MIKQLKIENFKCFDKESLFELSRFNIFSGFNGRGKSSVIQSYLLLCQSLCQFGNLQTLEVNGEYVGLGLFEDLVNANLNPKTPIRFTLVTDQKEGHDVFLAYEEMIDAERRGQICELRVDDIDYLVKNVVALGDNSRTSKVRVVDDYPESVNAIFRDCNYVSAERLGPSLFEVKRDLMAYNPVGANGENVLNSIAKNKKIKAEIIKWIDYIMSGGSLSMDGERKDSAVLSMNLAMPNTKKMIKSINCGFGYSYILSIVVNALTMTHGTLIIENPEAHLHPQAQIRLTELLSVVCGKDIQVFIETHSEHIVNGFRICALKDGIPMTNNDLSLYFFDEDYSVRHLKVEPNGRIKNWPKRFFDQFEWEMTEIMKLGSKV